MKSGKIVTGHSQEQTACTFLVWNMPFWNGTPPCRPNLIYITAGKCRCPKSTNRIKISWFVQVLLHFNWFTGSPLGGGWIWVGMGVGVCGVFHACMHMQTWTHMHAHECIINMIISCKWLPYREISRETIWCNTCVHVGVHTCMHMCMAHLPTHKHPPPPISIHPPPRGSPQIS